MRACMSYGRLSGLLTRSDLLFVVLLEEDIVVELGEAVVFETTPSSPLPRPSVSHFFAELIFFFLNWKRGDIFAKLAAVMLARSRLP